MINGGLRTRLEAMMRLLIDSGDMTPMAAHQMRRVLDEHDVILTEFTLYEFSEATGLTQGSIELARAWADFMNARPRQPFAGWWAENQGKYV